MKFLFFPLPLQGHLNPTLAVAQELARRGDEVVYFLPEALGAQVRPTGATYRPLDPGFDLPQPPEGDGEQDPRPVFIRAIARALRLCPALRERVRAEAADCIVYDPMCVWGQMMAESAGPRRALFSTTYVMDAAAPLTRELNSRARGGRAPSWRMILAMLEVAWAARVVHWRHGLPRLDLGGFTPSEPLNLVNVPRWFQPDSDFYDGRFHFLGPFLRPGAGAGDFPLERLTGQPLLLVSLGTVHTSTGFYRACVEAFAGSPWQVVMGVGKTDVAALGPLPENVLVRPHVPQLELLQRASAFITHGGMNSTLEALWFGVPMVAVPQEPEQEVTGRRLAELGLGVHLAPEGATVKALRDAVEAITTEASYRAKAAERSQAMREVDGARLAADELQRYARGNVSP
jgi:MGT family glycosyltransferase